MLRFVPRSLEAFPREAEEALLPYTGVVARLLYSRGITTAQAADTFLHPSADGLHDPFLMQGMARAVELITGARDDGAPVVVYGDYDVDGICAASLMTLALRQYGVKADHYTPLREAGYGLNCAAVRDLAEKYKLLITVDLGITNHEEVLLAQSLGMTVIVTDHHGLALTDSPADVAINPLLGDYPFRRLCGAGVAFKVAHALLGLEKAMEYIDLAALATVADIVPLVNENRIIVALGLPVIEKAQRPGMKALLEVAGSPSPVTSDTLGFQLGPRLNAAGRLDDAGKGVRLMMTSSPSEAETLAYELDQLNNDRKAAEARLVQAAQEAAMGHDFLKDPALIVAGDHWHVGVIGLAAGRLCNQYHCPVCVLSREDGMLHGSLRSVPGVHIHHCLQKLDDILLRYGGHELAAGVTLSVEHEEEFYRRLQEVVRQADPASFVPSQLYDAEVTLENCTDDLFRQLNRLAPFGCDNPTPLLFLRDAAVEERRAVGTGGAHLKLTLRQDKRVLGGIGFSLGQHASTMPDRIDAVFTLGQNTFRGVTSLQAEVKALLPVQEALRKSFDQPDGESHRLALLDALENLLPLAAGITPRDNELLEGYEETASAFEQALMNRSRGILAVSRTNASARYALQKGGLDVIRSAPTDPRSFHTLLIQPELTLCTGHWAEVWLLDGEAFPGEAALWKKQLPEAEIHALPVSRALRALASDTDPGDENCRKVYRQLKRQRIFTMEEAAGYAELPLSQTKAALMALRQLELITYTLNPFLYTLPEAHACTLSHSPVLRALRQLHQH